MEKIENFFKERGTPVFHEVSPLAGLELVAVLNERGDRPMEFTSVRSRAIIRKAAPAVPRNENIRVRAIAADEGE